MKVSYTVCCKANDLRNKISMPFTEYFNVKILWDSITCEVLLKVNKSFRVSHGLLQK